MPRPRTLLLVLGTGAAVAVAASRHFGGAARGHMAQGGVLMGDASAYDTMTRLLLGGFFRSIAADVATVAAPGAKVLEVGCGPGHLSMRLARDHGIDVTGLDLDPAMVERARSNAERALPHGDRPSFVAGDVAALPFPDASFDVVVSTLSMHHWSDPTAGLTEIARVLRPGGRALVWDIRPGALPIHGGVRDPRQRAHGGPLRVVSAVAWRWPRRFALADRIELANRDRE